MTAQFITVEGADGCGKTTQAEFIARWLADRGLSVTRTREPGGTALGEKLREIILHQNISGADASRSELKPPQPPTPETELLLLFAARAQHLAEIVQPALAAGNWVVCDRFIDSTYAYQGGGRRLSTALIAALEKKIIGARQPNLTILLDVPVEVCAMRAAKRNVFESQGAKFQQRIIQTFQARAAQFPQRIKSVDANQPLPQVRDAVAAVLTEFCEAQAVQFPTA